MSTTATRTYITPDLLSRPLWDFVPTGYGEPFFVSDDAPIMTPKLQESRDQAMDEYNKWETIDLDDL